MSIFHDMVCCIDYPTCKNRITAYNHTLWTMDVSNSSGTTSVRQYLFFQYILEENQRPNTTSLVLLFFLMPFTNFTPLKGFYPKTIIFSNLQAPPRLLFLPPCFSDCSFGFFLLGVEIRENQTDTHFWCRNFDTKPANTNLTFMHCYQG